MLGNYAPNKIAVRAPNRHDYAHVRAYLASLNADMVIYLPHSFLSFTFIILLIIFLFEINRWNGAHGDCGKLGYPEGVCPAWSWLGRGYSLRVPQGDTGTWESVSLGK